MKIDVIKKILMKNYPLPSILKKLKLCNGSADAQTQNNENYHISPMLKYM